MDAFQSILTPYLNIIKTPVIDYAERKLRLRLPKIPYHLFAELIKATERCFSDEPNILHLNGPIHVVGCLYGHILDLLGVLQTFGFPPKTHYLFLGNLIDQGEFSLEVLTLVFALKLIYPEFIHVIRGDHETKDVCLLKEFHNDLLADYDDKLFFPCIKAFSQIPLAAIIDNKFICLSGGFGPNILDITTVDFIKRPAIILNDPNLIEILFSDPTEYLPMFMPSSRGFGNLFGENAVSEFLKVNKFQGLIRGRQFEEEGVKMYFNQTCASVCTASGERGKPSVLRVEDGNLIPHNLKHLPPLNRADAVFILSESETTYVPDSDITKYRARKLSVGMLVLSGVKLGAQQSESGKRLSMTTLPRVKPDSHPVSKTQRNPPRRTIVRF
ncbi:Serine/threonine-protein phosphatase PP1 isozyme 5 [Tritrichomonas foetus]|uniref:protein-serine/threonine phosphatase n=1 Tax=Tritrichomonas foetus TaxID=1144522 RepID=A0A1J4K1I6_9EUKA|nr:Serine/threonine-protein phosphatase PP1 isozyme 5 [Tritrichomonas foetus]|eukprot:OHT05297.1 Serine/threonine-protein phosphatase PP1 isozyme 5 [Tritrichomonas foetus]